MQLTSANLLCTTVNRHTSHVPFAGDWLKVTRNLRLLHGMAASLQHHNGLYEAVDITAILDESLCESI